MHTMTTTTPLKTTPTRSEAIRLPNITITDNNFHDDEQEQYEKQANIDNDTDKYKLKYTYHRHEKVTSKLQSESYVDKLLVLSSATVSSSTSVAAAPPPPCRFLFSKGKNGRKTQLSKDTVTVVPYNRSTSSSAALSSTLDCYSDSNLNSNNNQNNDDRNRNQRIMIKYPTSGSTYHIRKEYLLPILQEEYQILVSPETDIYRRLCWVHTQYQDRFIEIGCDYGLTSGEVNVGDSSSVSSSSSSFKNNTTHKLGIDKSPKSIEIAKKNYPNDHFLEVDVLEITPQEMTDILEKYNLRQQQQQPQNNDGNNSSNSNSSSSKLVVAIDINGNRELNAVLQCLDRVLKYWEPKLVIVKSRSLYSKLIDMGY
mmetsp:Transcript_65622/g.73459  ORF Transcript_65622/g.73459 Transcript_65622/m.73459 type:complete len:368 (+) Transcript_65622:96-1199(+)